eukprot:COSAG03_NODE_3412_length_2032_cov_40.608898_3_plen_201_part_00
MCVDGARDSEEVAHRPALPSCAVGWSWPTASAVRGTRGVAVGACVFQVTFFRSTLSAQVLSWKKSTRTFFSLFSRTSRVTPIQGRGEEGKDCALGHRSGVGHPGLYLGKSGAPSTHIAPPREPRRRRRCSCCPALPLPKDREGRAHVVCVCVSAWVWSLRREGLRAGALPCRCHPSRTRRRSTPSHRRRATRTGATRGSP